MLQRKNKLASFNPKPGSNICNYDLVEEQEHKGMLKIEKLKRKTKMIRQSSSLIYQEDAYWMIEQHHKIGSTMMQKKRKRRKKYNLSLNLQTLIMNSQNFCPSYRFRLLMNPPPLSRQELNKKEAKECQENRSGWPKCDVQLILIRKLCKS